MGLDKASIKTRTRVSRVGAKALHAQGKAYKLTSAKAREAAMKRWASRKIVTQVQDASRDSRQQQEGLETPH
jgi:hypothetical protein